MNIKLIILLAALVPLENALAQEMPKELRGKWCWQDTYAQRCNKSPRMIVTRFKIDNCRVNYVSPGTGGLWRIDCREGARNGAYLFDLGIDGRFQLYDWSENYEIRQKVMEELND
jgi:hypothetical protein